MGSITDQYLIAAFRLRWAVPAPESHHHPAHGVPFLGSDSNMRMTTMIACVNYCRKRALAEDSITKGFWQKANWNQIEQTGDQPSDPHTSPDLYTAQKRKMIFNAAIFLHIREVGSDSAADISSTSNTWQSSVSRRRDRSMFRWSECLCWLVQRVY